MSGLCWCVRVCVLCKHAASPSAVYRLTFGVSIDASGSVCPTYGPLCCITSRAAHPPASPRRPPPPTLVQIMKEIQEHKIKIYEFPETDDEEEMKMIRRIKVCPF